MPSSEQMVLATSKGERSLQKLYRQIQGTHAKLMSPDGRMQSLPASPDEFLMKLISYLREGRDVAILQENAQLTTFEAARILGVSRQFLISLLERDEIPHHMVGTHRRVYMRDLLAFKAKRDSKRRRILDELSRVEAAEGLYDLEQPDAVKR